MTITSQENLIPTTEETAPHAPMAASRRGGGRESDSYMGDARYRERGGRAPRTQGEDAIYRSVMQMNAHEGAPGGWGWRYEDYQRLEYEDYRSLGRGIQSPATYVVAFNRQQPGVHRIVASEEGGPYGPMPIRADIIAGSNEITHNYSAVAAMALAFRKVSWSYWEWQGRSENRAGYRAGIVREPTGPMTEDQYLGFMRARIESMRQEMYGQRRSDAGHGVYQNVSYTPGAGEASPSGAGLPFSDVATADALTAAPNVRHNHSNQAPTRHQPTLIA